jgi:hypothetical protein
MAYWHNCFNAIDFSIYGQGIYELGTLKSLNPFTTIRNVHLFNDHFSPIMIFTGIFSRIFNYSGISLLVWEFLFFLSFLILFYKVLKKLGNDHLTIAVTLMTMLTCKLFLNGLLFPIHPDVWAILPISMIAYSLAFHKNSLLILSSIFLCLFKESYCFGILMLAFFHLVKKDYRLFLMLLLPSLLFIGFELFGRSYFFGPTVGYGKNFISVLFHSPLNFIDSALRNFSYWSTIKLIAPFIIPVVFIMKKAYRDFDYEWSLIFFLAPFIFLHFTMNAMNFQYGSLFGASLFSLCLFSKHFSLFLKQKKLVILTCLLFLATSLSSYTKIFKIIFLGQPSKCVISSEKTQNIKATIDWTNSFPLSTVIGASGGIIPQLLKPESQLFHIGGFSAIPAKYDVLILERNNTGDTYPLNSLQIEKTIQACASYVTNTLFDNHYFFVAEGNFSSCVPNWE